MRLSRKHLSKHLVAWAAASALIAGAFAPVTAAVAAPSLSSTRPSITGDVRVARTVAVRYGTRTKGTHFKVQWFLNGRKIAKATHVRLKIKSTWAGRKLSAHVTGRKNGYDKRVRATAAVTVKKSPKKWPAHATTPASLRGTWHIGHGETLVIHAHAVTVYSSPSKKKVIARLTPGGKTRAVRLVVTKHTTAEGYGGTVYTVSNPKYGYQDPLGCVWKSTRTYHGKKISVLKSYYNMGWFSVWTKSSAYPDLSYFSGGPNYLKKIGR